jgi:flagellar biosynthetic protein FliQ
MNAAYATDLLKMLMTNAVMLAAPILITAMIIGLAVSLFQSVTSIQEQTLTFVPKALAIVALLILLMPWMLRTMVEYASGMIERMPQMVQ